VPNATHTRLSVPYLNHADGQTVRQTVRWTQVVVALTWFLFFCCVQVYSCTCVIEVNCCYVGHSCIHISQNQLCFDIRQSCTDAVRSLLIVVHQPAQAVVVCLQSINSPSRLVFVRTQCWYYKLYVIEKCNFRVVCNVMKFIPNFIPNRPAVLELIHADAKKTQPCKVQSTHARATRTPNDSHAWCEQHIATFGDEIMCSLSTLHKKHIMTINSQNNK
jgi:hypothetical protein